MYKVPKTDYPAIAEMFNRDGRDATYEYIRDRYGMNCPDRLIAKLKKEPGFTFDKNTKKFTATGSEDADQLFMSLDELCSPMVTTHSAGEVYDSASAAKEAMDKLVRSLISDRLLELSKYVSLDTMTRTIMVDRSSMASDGYKVLIH